MTYPTTYPLTHAGFIPQTLPALPAYHGHPSHSIHVGAPNVNVDVHTTREHVAHNPEKQVGFTLVILMILCSSSIQHIINYSDSSMYIFSVFEIGLQVFSYKKKPKQASFYI